MKQILTTNHRLIAVILTVKIAIAQPRFVNTLVNLGTRELIVAANVSGRHGTVAVLLVGHVHTVVVTVAPPRRLHAPPACTGELRDIVALHWLCAQKDRHLYSAPQQELTAEALTCGSHSFHTANTPHLFTRRLSVTRGRNQ